MVRLQSGLTVPLLLPAVATRRAILARTVEARQIPMGAEVLDFVAEHVAAPVPELQGVLTELDALARFDSRKITLQFARDYLAGRQSSRPQLALRTIAGLTAQTLRLEGERFAERFPAASRVTARGVAMYLARTRA